MNERLRPKDDDIPGSLSASAIRWPRSEGFDRPSRGHEVRAVLPHLSDPAPWARRQEPESASDPIVAPRLEVAPSPQAYAMSSPTASMGGRRNPIVLPQSGQAPHDEHWGCRSGGRRVWPCVRSASLRVVRLRNGRQAHSPSPSKRTIGPI